MDRKEFRQITDRRYDAMVKRFSNKQAGPVPFSKDDYAIFVWNLLGRRTTGTVECHYCGANLHIGTLELDHRIAPSRGGMLGFENLTPCCSPCNAQKGEMTDDAFRQLLLFAGCMNLTDRANLLGRLQIATRFIHGQKAAQKRAKKQPGRVNWRTVRLAPVRTREPRGVA